MLVKLDLADRLLRKLRDLGVRHWARTVCVANPGPPSRPTAHPLLSFPIDVFSSDGLDSNERAHTRSIPARLRWKVLSRDDFTCQYCGHRASEARLEVDHAVARAAGGETDISNLITACIECNRGKSAGSVNPKTQVFQKR
ncbi:MAG TPA: HNH endonuclease [Thermoplasmata archaeon]